MNYKYRGIVVQGYANLQNHLSLSKLTLNVLIITEYEAIKALVRQELIDK